jgi:phosphotransferase system HPr (HPr) family protein
MYETRAMGNRRASERDVRIKGRSTFMVEREAVVVPEAGLHARPAAKFVKTAKGYSSDIVVVKDGAEVNAKSSLRLMTLGAKHGDKVVIRAEGEDEEAAAEALVALLSQEEEE